MEKESNSFGTNSVVISGEIVSECVHNHDVFGEGFYLIMLSTKRLSDKTDVIPIMVSERLFNCNENHTGEFIKVTGQFRSYNQQEGEKRRLILSVFAREIELLEEKPERDSNNIILEGYICKPPIYRKTPLGREISDILLAVNRPYGKSDYIPNVCWGRNAAYSEGFEVGKRLRVYGRIQSRTYDKRNEEGEIEQKICYEVSISKFEECEGE